MFELMSLKHATMNRRGHLYVREIETLSTKLENTQVILKTYPTEFPNQLFRIYNKRV